VTNVLQYEGKRVIVTGAASGTGAATTEILVELGAEVHAIDADKPAVKGLASFTPADLRDLSEIERAVAKIGKIINGLFNCATAPDTFSNLDVMLVNFCGTRALTEAVIPLMIEGSAIVSMSTASSAVSALAATPDFAAAKAWCEGQDLKNAYDDAAEAIFSYTAARASELADQGIRMNAANDAWPMVFLNSPRAAGVTGQLWGQPVPPGGTGGPQSSNQPTAPKPAGL
jgi:NAD(P)-dependent dehydrogenase (short-subunit alcohol dehydrogenase family)